jgi:anti-sigma regulatory factor (Ser/Thr protein kinase)
VTARRRFESSKDSIGAARRFVAQNLRGAPVEVLESVAVMVSELSTNALIHACSAFDVLVERTESSVVVAITDWGYGSPELHSPESTEPHGRGLRIVEALSDEWGTLSNSEEAKTIWFRLYLHASDTTLHATAIGVPVTTDHTGQRRDLRSPFPSPEMGRYGLDRPASSGATDEVAGCWGSASDQQVRECSLATSVRV